MKNIIAFLLASLLVLAGCTENQVTSSNETIPAAKSTVELPQKSNLNTESINIASKTINGLLGGSIPYVYSYTASNGSTVRVAAEITFPAGAFVGLKTISIQLDENEAAFKFDPSMVFLLPLKFNAIVTGLDLSNVNSSNLDFCYFHDNGSMTPVSHEGVNLHAATGTLTVKNAKINHFSRYGWAK